MLVLKVPSELFLAATVASSALGATDPLGLRAAGVVIAAASAVALYFQSRATSFAFAKAHWQPRPDASGKVAPSLVVPHWRHRGRRGTVLMRQANDSLTEHGLIHFSVLPTGEQMYGLHGLADTSDATFDGMIRFDAVA